MYMKARSGHIIISHIDYKDLYPVYEDIYKIYMKETNQDISTEEATVQLDVGLSDLKSNKKPAGFNKPGNVRFIFPIKDDKVIEFYFYRNVKSQDVVNVTQKISGLLNNKGIEHNIEYDKILGLFKKK